MQVNENEATLGETTFYVFHAWRVQRRLEREAELREEARRVAARRAQQELQWEAVKRQHGKRLQQWMRNRWAGIEHI